MTTAQLEGALVALAVIVIPLLLMVVWLMWLELRDAQKTAEYYGEKWDDLYRQVKDTRTYPEQMAYDITLMWSNDYDVYKYIQTLIDEADDWPVLSDALSDFYEESIDFVLRHTPEQSIGHMLVGEICYHIGRDVFDSIARDYWDERKLNEEAA